MGSFDESSNANFVWRRAETFATVVAVISLLGPSTARASLPDPPIFAAVQHYPSICYLPPDSGLCSGRNMKDASPPSPMLDPKSGAPMDASPPLASPPSAVIPSSPPSLPLLTLYYFDPTTEQCYPFGAQSCGGNENRFETLTDCQQRCRLRS